MTQKKCNTLHTYSYEWLLPGILIIWQTVTGKTLGKVTKEELFEMMNSNVINVKQVYGTFYKKKTYTCPITLEKRNSTEYTSYVLERFKLKHKEELEEMLNKHLGGGTVTVTGNVFTIETKRPVLHCELEGLSWTGSLFTTEKGVFRMVPNLV